MARLTTIEVRNEHGTVVYNITPTEQRIVALAEQHGWHVHERDGIGGAVELRKRGRGYLRVTIGINGHLYRATTATRYFRTIDQVREYLSH